MSYTPRFDIDLHEVKDFLEPYPDDYTTQLSIVDTTDIKHSLYFLSTNKDNTELTYNRQHDTPFPCAVVYSDILAAMSAINISGYNALSKVYNLYSVNFRKALRLDKDNLKSSKLWLIEYNSMCSVFKPEKIGSVKIEHLSIRTPADEIVTHLLELNESAFLTDTYYLPRGMWNVTRKNTDLSSVVQCDEETNKIVKQDPKLNDVVNKLSFTQRGFKYFKW